MHYLVRFIYLNSISTEPSFTEYSSYALTWISHLVNPRMNVSKVFNEKRLRGKQEEMTHFLHILSGEKSREQGLRK